MNIDISVHEILVTFPLFVFMGLIFAAIQKLLYKRSIGFKLAAVSTISVVMGAYASFVAGVHGAIHLLWLFPLFLPVFLLTSKWRLSFVLKPLSKMISSFHSLSKGDVDIDLKDKALYNSDEFADGAKALHSLVDSFRGMVDFATVIGQGNLDATYQLLSEKDALGTALVKMQRSLKETKTQQDMLRAEEEQRNWVTVGLAKFSEILRRDNNNMETLSYNVISNIVKYVDANQGGIFVLNEAENKADHVLELKACYAFDRKKFVDRQIHPGEGLVGTCYLEGEPIYLTDVPNEYITITSGLGDANPRAILICPLKVNDQIFGVIELASFRVFEPYQIDFVQKVSESIAATISTVNVNIRTNRLLDRTKLQAEEMANQEEELRQNMEEMQTTQEESRRREVELQDTLARIQEVQTAGAEKEHEMQQFHNGIFATNNVVEFSKEGIVTNVNQNLCNLFGLDRSVFVGTHMSVFNGEEVYNQIMRHLTNGNLFENVNEVNANGKILTIRQKFIPITNRDGHLERAMLLAFHDQEEDLRKSSEELENEMKQFYRMIVELNNVGEISADGYVTDVNQNLLDLWGIEKDFFVGKHYSFFVGDEAYNTVWADMVKGIAHKDVRPVTTSKGTKVFRHNFMPICDKNGKLLRVELLTFPENA